MWQVRRTGQIHKRFADRFAEKGRGGEIRSIINMQQGSSGSVRAVVKQALNEKLPVPDVAIAPYTEFGKQPALIKGLNVAEMDQAVDLWIYNLCYGRGKGTGPVPTMAAHRRAVDAVNAEFGTSVELCGYEGGVETAWPDVSTKLVRDATAGDTTFHVAAASLYSPGQFLRVGPEWVRVREVAGNDIVVDRAQSGTAAAAYRTGTAIRNAFVEASRDLVYHPNFYIAEFDQFGLWQKYFSRFNDRRLLARLCGRHPALGHVPLARTSLPVEATGATGNPTTASAWPSPASRTARSPPRIRT